jgi:hypothetical protein
MRENPPTSIWEPMPTHQAVFYVMQDMMHIAYTLDKLVCTIHTLRDDNVLSEPRPQKKSRKALITFDKKYVKPNGKGKLNGSESPQHRPKETKRAGKKTTKSTRVPATRKRLARRNHKKVR